MVTQNHLVRITVEVADKASKNLDKIKKESRSLMNNYMTIGFPLLFFGMAANKMFKNIAQSLVETFNKVENYQSNFHKGTMALSASWEFLKFSIVNALSQSELFQWLVKVIIDIVNSMSKWVNQHQELSKWILPLTILGILFTGLTVLMGQLVLSLPLLKLMFTGLGVAGKTALIGIGNAFAWLAANPIVILITALIAVIGVLIYMGYKMGGIGEFFKSVLRGMIRATLGFTDWFINIWIDAINAVVDVIFWLAKKWNDFAGSKAGKKLGLSDNKIDLNKFDYVGKSNLLEKYLDWEKSSWLAPEKGYMQPDEWNFFKSQLGAGLPPTGEEAGTTINIENINTEINAEGVMSEQELNQFILDQITAANASSISELEALIKSKTGTT